MPTSRNEPNRATCPDIDQAISLMEDLRESNRLLRDWGNGLVNDLEAQDEEIRTMDERINELESEVENLISELAAAKAAA
jgi:archaellum component FlaC